MFISEIFFKSLSELNENKQSQAHEYNLDAAQREMDRREAEGEDMSGARIDPKTYEIIKPKKNVDESQLNEYLVKAGMPVSDVLALNVFQDTSPDGQEGMDHDPQWQQLMAKYAPIANMLKKKILALGSKRRLSDAEANAIEDTWYDGSDAYDDMEVEYLADYYDQQIDIIEALLAGNITDEEFGEAFIAPALSAANANAEYERTRTHLGGYKGRVDTEVSSKEEYLAVGKALQRAAKQSGQHVEYGLSDNKMSIFSDSMNSDELDEFIDNALESLQESYPKHQDLSGISTDKLKAYLARQGQQQGSGEGNQVKRVRAELQRREQGMAEAFANPGSGSTGTSRGAKRIANTVRKALAKNAETPEQRAARKDFEARFDAERRKQQGVTEGYPSDNDMGTVAGTNNKMTLGQWKQMWQKKMPNADMSLFRFPPNMQGSAIANFDGWVNTPGARWDPEKSVAEGGPYDLPGIDYSRPGDTPAKPRYRGQQSPGVNPDDEAYFREIFRKKKLAQQKAERDADHSRLATGTNESIDNEQSSRDAVMSSIIRRITMQHLDALGKYGPQAIMDAAEETADWVGDVDEIGSSDISIWTRQTLERLGHK